MAGPRTKRQFAGAASDPAQRSITSFFNRATNTAPSADAASKTSSQSTFDGPPIPTQVQTDLLNVGMRVRKAIPEGYKTGSAYSGFTLWAEDNNNSNPTTTGDSYPTSTNPSAAPTSSLRELEPFCGINRVGGLAFQPSHSNNTNTNYQPTNDDDYMDDPDAMPGLTSSQDTITTITSSTSPSPGPLNIATAFAPHPPTTTTTRKRIFTSDEDDDVNGATANSSSTATLPYRGPVRLSSDSSPEAWLLEEEISPRNVTPPAGLWETARVLAVPRRSRTAGGSGGGGGKGFVAGGGGSGVGGGQEENVMVVVRREDGNDFEEASFLDYGLTGDGRMEIE
ncbi:ribonucleotide reductase inhibitor-domain-containing protein [Chaetomium fimeti]|uniref:Ribonucleotide reductase inhibitor-domain-containing protein n=1 Tax=Chaetomium fimeti TaxID=1854472 RepID=A0AAE0LUT5_9PEZI|nr:ribonucleotide reductase inhibitor-domain-containing protein [Chaetomium fimeti]